MWGLCPLTSTSHWMWPVLREVMAVGGLTLHEGRIWATNHSIHLIWLLKLDNNGTKWVHFPEIQILRLHPQRVYFSDSWTGPTESGSFKSPQMIQCLSYSATVGFYVSIMILLSESRQKALEIYNFQFQLFSLVALYRSSLLMVDQRAKSFSFVVCGHDMILLPMWPYLSLPSHERSSILCCNVFVYPLTYFIKYSSVVKKEATDCLLQDPYFHICWK